MTKSAIIFGASGGIGSQLAKRLHANGWTVHAVGRDLSRLSGLPEEIHLIEADATKPDGAEKAFEQAGEVHAAVNCIGSLHLKPLHRTTPLEFTEVMRLNVFSAWAITRAAVEAMKSGGSVVLMSSVAAGTGMVNHEAIGAAKGAVEGLVLSAAATYAAKGIRVNAVAPGMTETPMTAPLLNGPSRQISEKFHPLGRIGRPDDIASAIAWLIDPEQGWVTGQILHVDGGLGKLRGMPR